MKEIIAVSTQDPCCQLSLMWSVCSLFPSWWLSPRQAEAAPTAQGWISIISHSCLVSSMTEDWLQLPEHRHLIPFQNLKIFKAFTWMWHNPSRSPHQSTTNGGHRHPGERVRRATAWLLISCVETWTPAPYSAAVCWASWAACVAGAKDTPVRAISLSTTRACPELCDQSSPQSLLQSATAFLHPKLRGMHKSQGIVLWGCRHCRDSPGNTPKATQGSLKTVIGLLLLAQCFVL